MSASAIREAVREGIVRGLLPADAAPPAQDTRPWPVTLLTALGAWLAAMPLMGVVGLLLGDIISKSVGPYFVGVLTLAAAVTVLRSRDLPVFVEQLAVPALLVGLGALGYGVFRDLPDRLAAVLMGISVLGLAWAIGRPWLRVLLGAAAAGLCVAALLPVQELSRGTGSLMTFWLALHGALLAWLAALAVQRRALLQGPRAALASAVESVGAGWVLAVLAALAWWSGMTFLVGGSLGSGLIGAVARELGPQHQGLGLDDLFMRACSLALGAVSVLVAGRGWPALRQPAPAAVGLVLAALCWFLPALGGVLLALAWTATSQRWRLATAAAAAAAWIAGGFYYQLGWPLAHKALVLAAAGAALGAIAWFARRGPAAAAAPGPAPQGRGAAWMLAGVALVLAVANFSIWRKETLIAQGQKVFVALAPVDPRSLMQGDFMRLNYAVPGANDAQFRDLVSIRRPYAIARRDERGVAQLLRMAHGDAALQPGEMRIELTPKDGRWILVSDAWFFREGDGRRFEKARYGEFRVAPDGQALLVGLADQQLQTIPAQP